MYSAGDHGVDGISAATAYADHLDYGTLVYGFMKFNDPQKAVDYGAAHGALAMTTPGDTSMASLKEVEALVKGGSARVQR